MIHKLDFSEETIYFASNVILKIINFLYVIPHLFQHENNHILK